MTLKEAMEYQAPHIPDSDELWETIEDRAPAMTLPAVRLVQKKYGAQFDALIDRAAEQAEVIKALQRNIKRLQKAKKK